MMSFPRGKNWRAGRGPGSPRVHQTIFHHWPGGEDRWAGRRPGSQGRAGPHLHVAVKHAQALAHARLPGVVVALVAGGHHLGEGWGGRGAEWGWVFKTAPAFSQLFLPKAREAATQQPASARASRRAPPCTPLLHSAAQRARPLGSAQRRHRGCRLPQDQPATHLWTKSSEREQRRGQAGRGQGRRQAGGKQGARQGASRRETERGRELTMTRCPRAASAFGSACITSPSPPATQARGADLASPLLAL